jgi:Fur family ferric uptake transcriptional regulator
MRTRRGSQAGAEVRPQGRRLAASMAAPSARPVAEPSSAPIPDPLPDAWRERFRAAKVKATSNRVRVLGRFLRSDSAWTLRSLHLELNHELHCDLSSVYRALSDLRIAGFLEEFRLPGKRETFYALLGHGSARKPGRPAPRGDAHHHHHIVCEDCGRVSHLEMCLPAGLTGRVEGASGFRVTGHHLEFQGLCSECR